MNRSRRDYRNPSVQGDQGDDRNRTGATFPSSQVLAFNPTLRRPACVLIAAALGANPSFAHEFPASSWLVGGETNPDGSSAIDAIRCYWPLTRNQVRQIAQRLAQPRSHPAR